MELEREQAKFSNGSAVRLPRKPLPFLMVNGYLREFPNMKTLELMGYGHHVKKVGIYSFPAVIPRGPPLPSLWNPRTDWPPFTGGLIAIWSY